MMTNPTEASCSHTRAARPIRVLTGWLVASAAVAAAGSVAAQNLKPSTQLSIGRLGQASTPASRSEAFEQADYIVAVVNSEPITRNQLRNRVLQMEAQLKQQGQPAMARSDLTRIALERLINESAQVQEAKDTGIKIDEQAVTQAEENIARRSQMSVAQFRQALKLRGSNPERYREELRQQLAMTRLREREVEARVRVSDQDVDKFIAEQKAASSGNANPHINLAQILVVVPENATAEQQQALQQRAQQAYERAKAGEDFGKLVVEYATGLNPPPGGAMGLRPADRYPELFVEATKNVPVGGLSSLQRSGAGFHVLKVLERDTSGDLPGARVTQTHPRHILLRVSGKMTEAEALKQMAQWRERIVANKDDFAAIARQYSQDGSAQEGGNLGWVNPGVFVPEFEEVMNSLAINEISPPVVSRFGVHLIQVLERRETKLAPQEQREVIRGQLREKKLDEAFANWERELRGRAYVELRDPPEDV